MNSSSRPNTIIDGVQISGTNSSSAHKNEKVWNNLLRWVHEDHGGAIHQALRLEGDNDTKPRGVFATKAIEKGEWLIRLPSTCIVSGESLDPDASAAASSWLQCVAAYYQAMQSTTKKWGPYLDSLPAHEEYETLLHWTDEQVQNYLAGTTIGEMVQADRKEQLMKKRYQLAVRPFLRKLNLLAQPTVNVSSSGNDEVTQKEMDIFLQACMCVSTRGFHLSGPDIEDKTKESSSSYRGPFLLPVIDLLNHDPSRKSTTLQRDDSTGMFCMVAERDIAAGEEIFHSYGDTLTAAQLLQTFGFVHSQAKIKNAFTPVVFNKFTHLLGACNYIKKSDVPKKIQNWMISQSMVNDSDDIWDVGEISNRPLSDEDVPNDWLFSGNDGPTEILTDELITFLVLQYLPQDAYGEMVKADGRVSAWLDRSILDDVFLGKLVCHTLFETIQRRKAEYIPINIHRDRVPDPLSTEPIEDDNVLLENLLRVKRPDTSMLRAIYALRVRIEELFSLDAVMQATMRLSDDLDNGRSVNDNCSPSSKRSKLEPSRLHE